ncbi:hypothetical protein GCM10010124_40170 [Pilimelia terevasa]|uniref:Glycosyl transferase family 1 domain-containing protein n=1 Tax=Pilimelia terevasa TaxID=53372 RepID=A0A8J3FKT7_9ACTN|nr:glycosyltransferase [Pilimelia terevasa]GGK43368.1 hypothetical protein GCM10010124_40170 [Pilimelia terevasa]
MARDDSIVVLTTREREWWWSMQEVVPALEGVWEHIGQSTNETVRMLCVPLAAEVEESLRAAAPQPNRIVITSVTAETERIALLLRVQLKVDAPMTIYLCGDSTEGFDSFGALVEVLTERDAMIVSSEADAAATRCCFPKAQVFALPFPLIDRFKLNSQPSDRLLTSGRLAYVGRVSEQKNLHTLLLALWVLRTMAGRNLDLTLDVYGGEDNLGSPNMGLTFPGYEAFLRDLVERLGLTDVVRWHGFRQRDWLFENVHLRPHILVSPTLHSDENFGTSVLASLVNGHQVIATAWGGHVGFQDWFPHQLTTVPVHRSTMGPVADPVEFARAILYAVDRLPGFLVPEADLERARAAFTQSASAERILHLQYGPSGRTALLNMSSAMRQIRQRRMALDNRRKIYEGYHDPLVQPFFEAYGMKEPIVFDERCRYFLPPWITLTADALQIDDPHRGRHMLELRGPGATSRDVALCPTLESCHLPGTLIEDLVLKGYAFATPSQVVSGHAPAVATGTGLLATAD